MLFALFPINTSALADPELMARVAIAADEAGIESVFTGEHVVVPDPLAPPSHVPPETVLVHPSTALAFCAAVTRRLKLGTGITLLPSHNPLVVAKEYGSLDHLSGGRLILGIGVGYVPLEYEVLGLDFENRGRRTDEYIDAIRAMWTQPSPEFDGEFVAFQRDQRVPAAGAAAAADPRRRHERGCLPARRRTRQRMDRRWRHTRRRARRAGRDRDVRARATTDPRSSARSSSPSRRARALDRDLVAQFEDLGVTRCIVGFRAYGFEADADGYLRWVDTVAALA